MARIDQHLDAPVAKPAAPSIFNPPTVVPAAVGSETRAEEFRSVGPETKSVLTVLLWGFKAIVSAIRIASKASIDAAYSFEVLRNPKAFVFTRNPTMTPVTPGSPKKVYQNESTQAAVVYVRLQTNGQDTTAYLILDLDPNYTTMARARVVESGVAPSAQFILQPNQTLYADVTDSSGGVTSAWNVICIPIHTKGHGLGL